MVRVDTITSGVGVSVELLCLHNRDLREMQNHFTWLDSENTIECQLSSNHHDLDAVAIIEELMIKLAQRRLTQVKLLLDLTEFALTQHNITVLSNLILVMYSQRSLERGVYFGRNATILKILGASITYSVGIRLKNAPTRDAALQRLAHYGATV